MSNLIDFESSPPKTNVSFSLTSPLIPSPCRSLSFDADENENKTQVENEKSEIFPTTDSSPENNPFDVVMNKVVKYEQNQEDPYERIFENAKNFVYQLLASPNAKAMDRDEIGSLLRSDSLEMLVPACNQDELISSIEISFSELPVSSDDDEKNDDANKNLIKLSESPSKEEKGMPEAVEHSKDDKKELKELVEWQSCKNRSTAATALLTLKEFIKDENNVEASKALNDLQKFLDLKLDSSTDLLRICLQTDAEDVAEKKENKKESTDSQVSAKPNLNSTFKLTKSKLEHKDSIGTGLNQTANSLVKKVQKPSNRNSQSETKIKDTLTVKNYPKQATKSPVVQCTNTLKKTPSLKLPGKSSEALPLKRSTSVSPNFVKSSSSSVNEKIKSSSNVRKVSASTSNLKLGSTLKRGKPVDPKAKPQIVLNETTFLRVGDSTNRRPRIGTYTLRSPTSNIASPNNSNSDRKVIRSKSAAQDSKSPAVTKESKNFLLRRTSTTFGEMRRPAGLKNASSSSKMNETVIMQKNQALKPKAKPSQTSTKVPDFSREDLKNSNKILKPSTINSKLSSKTALEKKPERRAVLSPLENLKLSNKTKTLKTVQKQEVITIKKKTVEKENYV